MVSVEKWTGELIGEMHNCGITAAELASKLGVTKGYVSMVLNGIRHPKGAAERFGAALCELKAEMEEE